MASEFIFVSSSSEEEEEEEEDDEPPHLSLSDQESPASSLTEL
jgi:hypothetical protein